MKLLFVPNRNRGTKASWLHHVTRRPNEEGKSSENNKPALEDQDQHARTIRRTLTPFKTASATAIGFLLSAACAEFTLWVGSRDSN